MMINKTVGAALSVALMCGFACQPAKAQFDAGDALGLTTGILRLGVEISRANAEQERINAETRREQQAIAAQKAALGRRVQTALKTLGFYTMAIDGDWGPGTDRAVTAYQAAFDIYGPMDDGAIAELEWYAAQGWRSRDEIVAADRAGFEDRDTFIRAQEGGFADARQYEAAQAAGFDDAESFAAFEKSGAQDRASFEAQRAEAAIAAELAAQCLNGGDWQTAFASCRAAVAAAPSDAALQLALDRLLADASRGLEDNQRQLTDKKAKMAEMLAAKTVDESAVNTLRVEINALTETNLLVNLQIRLKDCDTLLSQKNWDGAVPSCHSGVDVSALSGDAREEAEQLVAQLAQGQQVAKKGQADERARLAEEARRLALSEATDKGRGLLDQLDAYVSGGNRFAKGVSIGRAIVTLRTSLDGRDPAKITADYDALTKLVEADAGFVTSRAALAEAQSQASQTALLLARRQAEMIDAYVIAFIGANVTSDKVADLLPVSESLTGALESGNGELIMSAQAKAREQLAKLGLSTDFASFEAAYQAPTVSAQAVEEAETAAANAAAAQANVEQAMATARREASELLDGIEAFAKSGGRLGDPVGVARAIARVKAELTQPRLEELTTLTADLNAVLAQDANYVAAMEARQSNQGSAMANAIALAREDLGRINAFLLEHIAANLTDDAIVQIVDLQVAVETALGSPDSAATVQARDQAVAELSALHLEEKARAYAVAQYAGQVTADAETAQNGLSITPANTALLDGDASDLVVLRRSDGQAPHLTYNLLGQLHVNGGVANACWAHEAPDNLLALLMARRELRELGVPDMELGVCAQGTASDLVLLRRGDFIASAPSAALPVVDAFEQGHLAILLTIDGPAADAEMTQMAQTVQTLTMALDNGTAKGFGLITLGSGKGDICPVVATMDPHIAPLVQRVDEVSFAIPSPRLGAPMSSEAAFAAAQRGQCSGLYADAATIKTFSEALGRIGVSYDLTTVWVEPGEVEAEVARLAAVAAEQVEQAAREAQEAEAAAAILAAQTADQRSALEKRQAASRVQYQDRADAGHKNIADMVRAKVGTGTSDDLRMWFPQLDENLSRLVHDQWALTDLRTELADYGTARWQGREVDAVLVTVIIDRENALAGVYGQDCLVLGWLIDTEFRVNRDAFEARCSDGGALSAWRAGREVESVWHLTAN